jgi:hypothetical protein
MRKLRRDNEKSPLLSKENGSGHPLLDSIRNRNSATPTAVAPVRLCEQDVGLNHAIIVHIYSPLVPTLNLVDLPGLIPVTGEDENETGEDVIEKGISRCEQVEHDITPSQCTDGVKRRPPIPRTNSTDSVMSGGSRRSSKSESMSSTGPPHAGKSKRRSSFSQRQTWHSVTVADRRLEIVERYILSYPDSLYLLVNGEVNKTSLNRGIIDRSLLGLVKRYELEVRVCLFASLLVFLILYYCHIAESFCWCFSL